MSNPEAASTPSSHDADDGNNTGFPFKLLPDTAKVEILEKIHAPQDKLNILRMLPQLTLNALGYDIAGWDYKSLQFELVYPLIFKYLKWPYARGSTWKNVMNLCKASPELQKIVTSHFEKYITLPHNSGCHYFREYLQEPIYSSEDLSNIVEAASDKTFSPWLTTLPFVVTTGIFNRSEVPSLTKLNKKVWGLGLSLMSAHSRPEAIDNLAECLSLVPDLRRLHVAESYPSADNLPPPVVDEERLARVLPELPYLKMIFLFKDCSNFQKWVLPKYAHLLEVLELQDCYLTDIFTPTCFPKLEAIHIKFSLEEREHVNASIDNVNGLLNKFLLSPLKVITVILEGVEVLKFFNFMRTLNNFGKSLETLEMKFLGMNAQMGVEVMNEVEGWISQLSFPKMNCLELDSYVGPLEFLLRMPALKKLNIISNSLQPLMLSNEHALRFTINQTGTLESSIWQVLKDLEWLHVDFTIYTEGNMRDANGRLGKLYFPTTRYTYNITRRQTYKRHQRNKIY